MATRVPKTGASGGVEFAQGSQPLHIAELDGDLDAIFGSITNANVAVGANIATSKLAVDGGIIAGMLGSNSVTTLKIADQPNGVTTAKLNIGASINGLVTTAVTAGLLSGSTDTLIATLPNLTTRGGRVLVLGTVTGTYVLASGAGQEIRFTLKRDTVPSTGLVSVGFWTVIGARNQNASAVTQAIFVPVLAVDSGLAAATYTYTVTVATPVNANLFQTESPSGSNLFALEFA